MPRRPAKPKAQAPTQTFLDPTVWTLDQRVAALETTLEFLMKTVADLTKALEALHEAIGKLPPHVMTQADLDAAVDGVIAATAAVLAKAPA